MNKTTKNFFLKIFYLTLSIAFGGAILFFTVLKPYFQPIYPIALVFIASITAWVYSILMKASTKNARAFSTSFMLSILIRLFGYSIFLVFYLFFNRGTEIVLPFVLVFLSLYFIYTVFEIRFILRDLNKKMKVN